MQTNISITGMGSISPLGADRANIWRQYLSDKPLLVGQQVGEELLPVGRLQEESYTLIREIRQENARYRSVDPTVLYALYASRQALQEAGWEQGKDFGVNIGSSRGATTLFEEYHQNFLEQGKCAPLASPTTSLGNIASWVMQDAKGQGVAISHSITCSTALHALLNGIAWLHADMAEGFLVGGSEAPLTPFTLFQMKALKIYGSLSDSYPCQPLLLEKLKNTMVLGEGSAVFAIEKGVRPNALAIVKGIGYATEVITHPVAISAQAEALRLSMQQALQGVAPAEVDVVIPHATGTIKGDEAEYHALREVFGQNLPRLTSNKWKIGHTFAASGALAIEMAVLMLQNQQFLPLPYLKKEAEAPLRNILINATGFGGNAVSVLIGLPY
ncbi:beta-ketoacyl synthase N-terminal-like domain-containing protein [Capnocytophaga gingivalis]|uniref:beta-ketoacyl synthase N-terminal-like domain-containing protein n=1 Tax=Capnocytophaga gingivalis TaxID=1017 RepID=UPI003C78F430